MIVGVFRMREPDGGAGGGATAAEQGVCTAVFGGDALGQGSNKHMHLAVLWKSEAAPNSIMLAGWPLIVKFAIREFHVAGGMAAMVR